MKVRVKFQKEGPVKFVGHLDTLRYFQKSMRRAKIDVAYSEGYSPHMIMSFASPLGVGLTTEGDYFDMELKTSSSSKEMIRRLNNTMAEGIRVLSIRQIPEEKSSNGMALVCACDYLISFREGMGFRDGWKDHVCRFLLQEHIFFEKTTKKGTQEIDIRPLIYQMEVRGKTIFLQLSAGSVNNLKPEIVLDAFSAYLGETFSPYAFLIHRLEIYTDLGKDGEHQLVPLECLGTEIE